MSQPCPVCSAPDQACGHTELALPPIHVPFPKGATDTMANTEGTIYLPKQHVRPGRGKPGYKGENIKVVADPAKAEAEDRAKAEKAAAKAEK